MKNILLILAAGICLFTSCSKQTDSSPPVAHAVHNTAKEVLNHSATITEANQWITAYNDAHVGDTTNKTLFAEKEMLHIHDDNPDVFFYTVRFGLNEGHNTIVIVGWNEAGTVPVTVDQHIGIYCQQCGCCTSVSLNADGTIPV